MKDLAFKLFPFTLLLAFSVKCLATTATYADSIIFWALVAYITADSLRLTHSKTAEFQKTLEKMLADQELMKNDIKNVQNNVNGVKLGMGIKNLHNQSNKNG